jgi:hypothetical protein
MSTTRPIVTAEQMRWFRLRRGGLITPFPTAEAAAQALVGVQAQILPAAGLALWNRTPDLDHTRFERLLYADRTLVKLWGQRGTLHLYAGTDWPLLYAARSVNRTWWERETERNGQSLADHHALVEAIARYMAGRDLTSRADLSAAGFPLNDDHMSAWGGIFADLVRLGYACHAGRAGNQGQFAHRERWLPDLAWNPPDPDTANRTILMRFFAAYGPATLHDFAYWRYATLSHARAWANDLADQLAEVEVEGQTMLVRREDLDDLCVTPPAAEGWPVRLLYRFEPYLLGHRDKGWVVDPAHYKAVWRPAGHIEGIVLAHGRGVGVWRYDRKAKGLAISVAHFKRLPAYAKRRLEPLATGIAGFFGLPLVDLTVAKL